MLQSLTRQINRCESKTTGEQGFTFFNKVVILLKPLMAFINL